MAIGGKTLGIVSGLAVGLTSGVILAALNPIVPQTGDPAPTQPIDEVAVAPAPAEKTEPALPKLSMVETPQEVELSPAPETAVDEVADVVEPDAEPEEVVEAEAPAPELAEPNVSTDLATDPEAMDQGTEPATELALVLPENSDTAAIEDAPAEPSEAASDATPTVSTEPAEAVKLAEPTLDTQSPEVDATEIAQTDPVAVSDVAEPSQTEEPSALATAETVVASLPTIEDPEAPQPAAAPVQTEVVEEVAEPVVEAAQRNTSGTFKTSGGSLIDRGSSLPSLGQSEDTGLAALGTAGGSNRFKTIGESSEVATAPTPETTGDSTPDLGALVRNANDFPVTNTPLVSVILLDDGRIASQLESLKTLNLQLTIAVSLDDADAGERAAQYRAAGFEVLAMSPRNVKLSLSGGQSDDQVAALLDEYFAIMPEAVGLIDRPSANLQKDQRLSRYVVEHFAKTGHGLVTYAGGLNGTRRIAEQEGVSSGSVFQFLDKSGEAGAILTQQLDRAAREARSKGAAIVMATPSDATLGTLVSWSLSSKARAVRMAPVSASLLKG